MSAENRPSASRGLRRLLDSIRGRGNNNRPTVENEEDAHPLPFLPANRPRPLTPTVSQQSPTTLGTLVRLPPELRRRILITAFGGRTLHLDLQVAHPRRADAVDAALASLSRSSGPGHGLGASPSGYYYFADRDAPQAWRWTSCVCHRLIPPGSGWEQYFLEKGSPTYRYPHTDQCLEGDARFCWMWPGPPTNNPGESGYAPGKCMVGAMGWLLACRQAYAEGIDVLYSTNTFFIEGDALLSNLVCRDPALSTSRHLILPERLERITSLELRWKLLLFGNPYRPYRGTEHNAAEDRALLATDLRHLCGPFPNLRKLVLSFSDPLYRDRQVRPRDTLDEIERVLLRPLADAVARLPLPAWQKGVLVELPTNVFQDLGGLGLEGEEKGYEMGDEKGVWLRYPLSRAPRLAESEQSSHSASEPGNGSDGFYYIKQGEESDLFWNWKGEPKSRAALGAVQVCPG